MFDKELKKLILYPRGREGDEYIVPEGVETIDDYAFFSSSLKKIILPDTVKYINKRAFQDCTNLDEVKMSNSIERIEELAFSSCSSLSELFLPKSIEFIGDAVFICCKITLHIDKPMDRVPDCPTLPGLNWNNDLEVKVIWQD